jgi:hypothetical protein
MVAALGQGLCSGVCVEKVFQFFDGCKPCEILIEGRNATNCFVM